MRTMGAPAKQRDSAIDAHGRVANGVMCVSCAQDLGGLEPGGVCPECGSSIKRSLAGPRLFYADPDWIKTLARGARLANLGTLGTLIGLGLAFVLGAGLWLATEIGVGPPSIVRTVIVYTLLALAGLSTITGLAGVWLTLTPGRGSTRVSGRKNHALRGRILIAGVGLTTLANLLLGVSGAWRSLGQLVGWVWRDGAVWALITISIVLFVFGVSAWCRTMRVLTARIYPRSLFKRWNVFAKIITVNAWMTASMIVTFSLLSQAAMPLASRLSGPTGAILVPITFAVGCTAFALLGLSLAWVGCAVRAMQLASVSHRALNDVHQKSLRVDQSS